MENELETKKVKERLANLKTWMPEADDTLCKFCKFLSLQLNPVLVPAGFLMMFSLTQYDLNTKVNNSKQDDRLFNDLCGYPPMMIAMWEMVFFDSIIYKVLPKDFADKVKELYEKINQE